MKKRILVTGADGFIGKPMCERLAQEYEVVALLAKKCEGPWSSMIIADLVNDEIDLSAVAPIDTIIHLAGKAHAISEVGESDEYFALNTKGTAKVLKAAQKIGVRRFVFFSSVKAMGEGRHQAEDEQTPCRPSGPYGQSKLDAEKLVLEGNYVPEPVVLRPSMVYGPTDKGNLPRMIKMIRKGLFMPLPDTNNRRSMIHLDDVINAAVLAATHPAAAGQTYILTDGQPYSTSQICEIIYDALGYKMPKFKLSTAGLKVLARVGDLIGKVRGRRFAFDSAASAKLLGSAFYSNEKIVRELDFKPLSNLEEAMPHIITFLEQNK